MKKILLFLSLLCCAIVLITSTELFSQRGMKGPVRVEAGEKLALYNDSYALVIGNGAYPVKNGWNPLPGAVNDVKEVAEVFKRHGFNVTLKIDVTKAEFNKAFSKFIYKSGKDRNNRLLFYYAGHGYTTKSATGEDLGYLVMLDTPHPENAAEFDLYSVDMVKFVSDSKKIHAKHVLFMFDSCFSGTVLNLRNRVTPSHITDRIKNPVRQFITAGRADEPVPDKSEFKKAFLNLLEGRVEEPTPDGYLTGVELGDYLYRTVPKFSQGQHPQHGKIHDQQLNTGDFVFVLPQNDRDVNENDGVELDTMATLNITSNPSGAAVYIDGTFIGITPVPGYQIDTGVRLEKQVNVGLELSGYKSRVKKIILKGSQLFPWNVDLEKMERESEPPKPTPSIPQTIVKDDIVLNEEARSPSSNIPQTVLGKDGAPMVLIPAGEFQMGHNGNTTTSPVHTVYADAFYMDVHEVTVGQYNQFVRATGHPSPPLPDWASASPLNSRDRHPIVNVTWHDAMAYAKWAGKRLPTEAEWEKASRGGLEGQRYPWGNAPPDGTQCNFADQNLSKVWDSERTVQIAKHPIKKAGDDWSDKYIDDGYAHTAPVGSYPPNGYGLYDMAGNVWEWCFDAHDENFYANSPRRNPIASIIIRDAENNRVTVNDLRVARGGSWFDRAEDMQVSGRGNGAISTGMWTTNGFRCVKSASSAIQTN